MKPADSVTVSAHVAVDPATAFAVFTSELDSWWKRGPAYRTARGHDSIMRLEPGVGGRLVEVYDEASGEGFELGRVLVWKPAERLVFEYRIPNFAPGESTEVDVRFEAVAGGTQVSIEHRGWDCLPPDHPARHGLDDRALAQQRGSWWIDQLRALRRLATRSAGC